MKKLRDIMTRIIHDENPSAAGCVLYPFSLLYGGAVECRNGLYNRNLLHAHRLPCPVISVGNITVGGTGKTPTVIMLAKLLLTHGYHPAILSRGYGGTKGSGVLVVSDGKSVLADHRAAGDEPVLIARSVPAVPVITGANRHLAGFTAIDRFGADTLILDDGFQHRALTRDVDIVLLDAARPFGNGHLLPRGPLREPPKNLSRASVIVITDTEPDRKEEDNLNATLAVHAPAATLFHGFRRASEITDGFLSTTIPAESLAHEKVLAFSGIASPEGFQKTLASLCGRLIRFIAFPDHHRYRRSNIDDILRIARESTADRILTTEKDAVKLVDFPDFVRNISVVRIEMNIHPAAAFEHTILERITT